MTEALALIGVMWCRWTHRGILLGHVAYECAECGRRYATPWCPSREIPDGVWRREA